MTNSRVPTDIEIAQASEMHGIDEVAAAIGLGTAAESLLFGLKGYDPLVLGTVSLVLAAVAFCAGYLPAWRASRIEPMKALRYE